MSDVLKRLQAARERWITLDDSRQVRIRRPVAAKLPALLQSAGVEPFLDCVTDWRGFTEASVLGAAVASDTVIPFDAALWRELALDNVTWLPKVANAVIEDASAFLKTIEAAAGN